MFTVACVLKSGGIYDSSWVEKLQRGVARNLKRPHRFFCLSDVDVPCERMPMHHDWPGWWSKLELFRPGVITDDTLYLDLDTVITGPLDGLVNIDSDFAVLRSFADSTAPATGVMWIRKPPFEVYKKFAKQPEAWMEYYRRHRNGAYVGDQAFIKDHIKGQMDFLTDLYAGITSYKLHHRKKLLPGTSIVCFPGEPKCAEVDADWMKEAWV